MNRKGADFHRNISWRVSLGVLHRCGSFLLDEHCIGKLLSLKLLPSTALASPHHPVMFYMVQHTIFRLLTQVKSIRDQYVPFVTGPGATKEAMSIAIGRAYPTRGQYAGVNGRNVTIVGHRSAQGHYVIRLFERGAMVDYVSMNMTHYSWKEAIPAPSHSCLMELYKNAG